MSQTRCYPAAIVISLLLLQGASLAGLWAGPAPAKSLVETQPPIEDTRQGWEFGGNVRLLYEHEEVEDTSFGDRQRLRLRLRLETSYYFSEQAWFHLRARTGPEDDITSADWTLTTFEDGFETEAIFYPDIYTFNYESDSGRQQFALGRMLWPLYENSEWILDNDATLLGGYARFQWPCRFEPPTSETWNEFRTGVFFQPDGVFNQHSYVAAAQLLREQDTSFGAFLVGAGIVYWAGDEGAEYLDPETSSEDVTQFLANFTYRPEGDPVIPWEFGVDYIRNLNSLPVTGGGDRNGVSVNLQIGEDDEAGDWQATYEYFYMGGGATFDDWGASSYSRIGSSNIRGHDIRLTYALRDDLTLTGRAVLTDQIAGAAETNRFRVYFVWDF